MNVEAQIKQFIKHPFPLWETALTQELVQNKWNELQAQSLNDSSYYSTGRIWCKNSKLELSKRVAVTKSNNAIQLEFPSFELLHSFYDEHGLEPSTEHEIESNVLCKLQGALKVLQQVESVYDCIENLVRTIQVLRTDDADIDLSYSHPNIPFSIFISVCDNESMISNLRVAESILHEAMHLKLTLIEDLIPLIKPDTNSLYYSPWRNEERPAKGVLHGLFVFRAIREFYKELQKIGIFIDSENYLENRLREIENEVEQLKDFATSPSLNELGTNLVISLLPLN